MSERLIPVRDPDSPDIIEGYVWSGRLESLRVQIFSGRTEEDGPAMLLALSTGGGKYVLTDYTDVHSAYSAMDILVKSLDIPITPSLHVEDVKHS